MKQVILIHGLPSKEEFFDENRPSPSNMHWFPWIQQKLSKQNIVSQSLEMPHPYNPIFADHSAVLDQMSISNETILVGYSCGGGFLIRYFSENKNKTPKKIILVAPWLDPENYLKELNPESNFFNFEIDPSLVDRIEIHCVYSTDDEDFILESVKRIKETLPSVIMHEFTNKGHFCESDLGGKEFPELLELILEDA